MAIEIIDKKYLGLFQFDCPAPHQNLDFVNCQFTGCSIGLETHDLALRPRAAHLTFRNCIQAGCSLRGVIVEDTVVDGLKCSSLLQTWAAVFKHVTLRGKIDRLMLSDLFHPGEPDSKFQLVVAQANAKYYASVDWAIDIREAEFKDFDCRGVPSRLVRRDPETQVMVTRSRVLACGDAITAGGQFWAGMLKAFLGRESYADAIYAAPKRDPRFKDLVAGLQELRRNGVTEPD